MRNALCGLSLVLVVAAPAAAQSVPTRVVTNEGSVLNGSITGGNVTLKTAFGGDVSIDPRRIQSLSGTTLTLDDGSVVQGKLVGGAMQFASAFGTLAIPVERVTEIQNAKAKTAVAPTASAVAAAVPPAAVPAVVVAAAPPNAVSAPVKPATAAVQIVNETRRTLSVCLNDEMPCLTMGPKGSSTKTLAVGQLRMRVESTTQLGFVLLATGDFEKSLAVDKDTTVRVTETDFR